MTVRSFTNNFEVVDSTRELNTLPQTWTLLGDSGLFKDEFLSQNVVTFQETKGSIAIVKDQVRGTKPQTTSNDVRKIHSYSLTHHPLMDALYPDDIAGKSAYGDLSQADTEAQALLRKMTKIRKSFDVTKEIARFQTITTGAAYAPNGTVVANYYTDFGFTRNEVDFVWATTTTDIVAKCEAVIRGFQDSATDGVIINSVTAYCSPAFFGKLINHSRVQAAYTYYSATEGQSILRNRAGGMGLYRRFTFANINFVEVPTVLAGQALIPAGDAYFVAESDDDSFVTVYGPANRFGLVNTIAQPMYLWQFRDPRGTEITLESEVNMLSLLKRPNFVARGFSST
jgi:hypothetical protein